MIGMLIGSVVGAGAALLFAPMEGAQTRQKITDVSKSARDRVTQVASGVKGRVQPAGEPVKPAM